MASATVGILRVLLTADAAEFASGIKAAQSAAASLGKDFKQLGQQATELGGMLSKTLTLPLVGLGVGAAKAAMDFESSFAGVRKTVQATDAEFAIMEQSFRDLSTVIPINVNDLNRLGEAAGALGIPKEEVVDFARVMALLGVTTNVTADQAAESIAKVQNIFGAAGKDTDRFASTLVALGNSGASTESQILEMATRIAGAGNVIGLSQGEVLAFASALSSVGIEAEMGGSAISRVFIDIASSVSKGGDDVAGFAKVAGMSIEQFSKLFKDDAAKAVEAFLVGLGKIKTGGGDLLGTLEELGFSEIRVRDTLLRTAGAGDLLTKALDLQRDAWQKNSALTDEAAQRFKTTESQLALLWNRIKDVGITLGNALLPTIQLTIDAVNKLVPVIDSIARGFAGLPAPVQAVIIGFAAALAAAGPLIWGLGQLFTAAGAVTGAFAAKGIATRALTALLPGLSTAIASVRAAMTGASAAASSAAIGVTALSTGIGILAVAGIAIIAKQFYDLNKELEETEKRFVTMAAATKIAGHPVKDYAEALGILAAAQAGASGETFKHERMTLDMGKAWMDARVKAQGLSAATGGISISLDAARAAFNQTKTATTGNVTATRDYVAQLEASRAKLAALTPETRRQLDAAILLEGATEKVAKQFGLTDKELSLYQAGLKATQKATTDAIKDHKEHEAALHKVSLMLIEGTSSWDDFAKAVAGRTKDVSKAIIDNYTIQKDAQLELDTLVRERTMSRLQFELDALQRKGENEKLAIDQSVEGWRKASDAIDAVTSEKMTQLALHSDEVTAALAAMSGIFPGLLPFLRDYLDTLDGAADKTKGWGVALSDFAADVPKQLMAAFTGGGGLGGALQAIFVDLGTMLGQRLGTSIANSIGSTSGNWSKALGGLFGGVVGLYVAAWEAGKTVSMINRVGNTWGHAVSEGMAKAIQEDADKLFNGDIVRAGLFNLRKNIDDTVGGISSNFGKFADLLGKAVLGYASGTFTAAQATKILGETWADFVAAGTDATGRLAPQLVLVHQAATALGLKIPEITQYLKDQAAIVTSGFAATIGAFEGQFASYSRFGDAVKAAQKDVDDLRGKVETGGATLDEYRKAQERLTNALLTQSGAALAAQAPLADLGLIALSSFNAAFKASGDYYGALKSIGPALTDLQKAYTDLGLNVEDAALKELLLQNSILTANPALVTAIGSLSQQFIALSNMGLLNVDTFMAMERTALGMYTKLQSATAAAGGTTRDALLPMQQYLHDAEVQAALLGIPLDANTQMLIAQSKELGIWKDKGKDANEKLYDGVLLLNTTMQGLVDLIAAKLLPAIAGIGPAGVGAATTAEGGIRGRLIPALIDAKAAADALNFGESPGGLKEIPLLLDKAGVSAGSFTEKFTKLFGIDCVGAIDKTILKFWRLDEANDRVLLNFDEKWKIGLKTWEDKVGETTKQIKVKIIDELGGDIDKFIWDFDDQTDISLTTWVDGFEDATTKIKRLLDEVGKGMGDPLQGGIGRGGSGDVASMFRELPALGNGGIVTMPTLAWVGESGREAVIPLPAGNSGVLGGTTQRINVYLDSRVLTKATVRGMPSVLELHGVKTS